MKNDSELDMNMRHRQVELFVLTTLQCCLSYIFLLVSSRRQVRIKIYFVFVCRVGGSIPVIFSYFSEFMPRLRRGAMISCLATFWMTGNILAAGGKLQEIKYQYYRTHLASISIVLIMLKRVYLLFVCRSGVVGDSKNLDTFFSGISGFSELESVCGGLLNSQPHISPHLQTPHA